jgi:hypothetical protein
MIVREHGAALQLITQPDHAALSRRIMERWVADGFADAPRRAPILHAIGAHDDGWIEVDRAPIVDRASGRLADFVSAPAEIRRGIWPRGVARLGGDGWAAALVAQHAIYIYRRYRADASWSAFFAEMEQLRGRFAGVAGLTLDELAADYLFLRIGDLISLSFCNEWGHTEQDFGYSIRCEGARVVVTPDPFDGTPVPITIPARELPNRIYRDAADAAAAWAGGRRIELSGTVQGGRLT